MDEQERCDQETLRRELRDARLSGQETNPLVAELSGILAGTGVTRDFGRDLWAAAEEHDPGAKVDPLAAELLRVKAGTGVMRGFAQSLSVSARAAVALGLVVDPRDARDRARWELLAGMARRAQESDRIELDGPEQSHRVIDGVLVNPGLPALPAGRGGSDPRADTETDDGE